MTLCEVFTAPVAIPEMLMSPSEIIILRGEAKDAFVKSIVGKFDPCPVFESAVLSQADLAAEIVGTKCSLGSGGSLGNMFGRRWDYR